jgi:hypothetical protein
MLTDVGPVELWATRWRRPSAAANPQGSPRPPTPPLVSCSPGPVAAASRCARAQTGCPADAGRVRLPELDDPFRWDLEVFPTADRIARHEGIELFTPDHDTRPQNIWRMIRRRASAADMRRKSAVTRSVPPALPPTSPTAERSSPRRKWRHESRRAMKLYDRTKERLMQDKVERSGCKSAPDAFWTPFKTLDAI